MGWFLGISGRNQSLKESAHTLPSSSNFKKIESNAFFLVFGGCDQTTFSQYNSEQNSGWVTSGIGISNDDSPTLLGQTEWNQVVQKGVNSLHQMNGHFAACKWKGQKIELITDQLGMRSIFIHQAKDFVLFSTRLDWIKKLVPDTIINWKKFGSTWLALNQFSSKSFVQGVERISQGGHATITPDGVSISNQRWNYSYREVDPQSFMNALSDFSTLPLKQGRPLSLGLSGGLDSRTLFAILLKHADSYWATHTFGEANHPDFKTASSLNRLYGKKHYAFHEKVPTANEIEEFLPDYIGQTILTSTPSHFVGFQAYHKIHELGFSVIDGGFGEIARRRFMNSILLRAKTALLNKDITALMPYLRLSRADIFTKECINTMSSGFEEELEEEINAMPEIQEIGIENWLDLFTVRTRVPNGAGPEQARSDNELFNYMPFLQPDFIDQALNLPVKDRNNAHVFRSFIKKNAPGLQRESLIKGDYSYPYWMNDITSALWMRAKQKLGMKYQSTQTIDFLLTIEDYIRDLYNSRSAKEYSAYDHKKIDQIITGFFDNENRDLAHQLNWWLAFEIFRRI